MKTIGFLFLLLFILICGVRMHSVFAQESTSVLYVPLIGLTTVPDQLSLPNGPGDVTYNYAVKNFLREVPLKNIDVYDDSCSSVTFVTGDDNNDSNLDYSETWRYSCTTKVFQSTQSLAIATGQANSITATNKSYVTVIVGQKDPAPLVSIINITKVAYPLSLPAEGGTITFTYKVNNPGLSPLSNVIVTDNKCRVISGKLGDTNANNLLDVTEVWIYTCTTHLEKTTTNTASVTASANGLEAFDDVSITVEVDNQSIPFFPETGGNARFKITIWVIMIVIFILLITFSVLVRKNRRGKTQKKLKSRKW